MIYDIYPYTQCIALGLLVYFICKLAALACDYSSAFACDYSFVLACVYSSILACDYSSVLACDYSSAVFASLRGIEKFFFTFLIIPNHR